MIHPHEIRRRERFGALYNFHCTQYIAPLGWRVPTWDDFEELRSFVDPSGAGNINSAGAYLGSAYLWLPLVSYSDLHDFTALPGGYRQDSGVFANLHSRCNFWTSTEYSTLVGISAEINAPYPALWYTANKHKRCGLSIRLIKQDGNLPSNGSFTDFDGNTYWVVRIGNQVWMAENYRCTRLDSGTPIPLVSNNPDWAAMTGMAMCFYDNDMTLC